MKNPVTQVEERPQYPPGHLTGSRIHTQQSCGIGNPVQVSIMFFVPVCSVDSSVHRALTHDSLGRSSGVSINHAAGQGFSILRHLFWWAELCLQTVQDQNKELSLGTKTVETINLQHKNSQETIYFSVMKVPLREPLCLGCGRLWGASLDWATFHPKALWSGLAVLPSHTVKWMMG